MHRKTRLALVAGGSAAAVAAVGGIVALVAPEAESTASPSSSSEAAWRLVQPGDRAGKQVLAMASTPAGGMWSAAYDSSTYKMTVARLGANGWAPVALPTALNRTLPRGMSATSASNVWIAGDRTNTGNNRVLQWNGTAWKDHDLGAGYFPQGVVTMGPKAVWVYGIGRDYVRYWNGSSFKNQTVGLRPWSVGGTKSTDLWAGGHTNGVPSLAHWNGTAWKRSSLPAIPGLNTKGEAASTFRAVTALSATNVWAAGTAYVQEGGKSVAKALLAHWNGKAWKVALGTAGTYYLQMAPDGAGGIWIAQGTTMRHRTKTGTWTKAALTIPAGVSSTYVSVMANQTGSRTVWAAGGLYTGGKMNSAYWH
ncbi:hypothetical protein [Actinomadura oligospora]|uniref:hypothetical protein n=1 Tax=Actinomadura oligospora TaxID=111804 RepID=UPI00047B61D0|nr:hypothetical protein [Actinomadura oligospora]